MITIQFLKKILTILIAGIFPIISACSYHPIKPNPAFSSVRPPVTLPPPVANGAIYKSQTSLSMFETAKAKRVGDILTIVFDESHAATKSSKTEDARDTSLTTDIPNVLGNTISQKLLDKVAIGVESSSDFSSAGKSEQNNSLTGSLTVSVIEVLANNNLVVRGEKLLTLNQGDEYVQLSGVIRSMDIGADNKVVSSKVANARIIYSGQGTTHESNKPGWATRFFMGGLWPF